MLLLLGGQPCYCYCYWEANLVIVIAIGRPTLLLLLFLGEANLFNVIVIGRGQPCSCYCYWETNVADKLHMMIMTKLCIMTRSKVYHH